MIYQYHDLKAYGKVLHVILSSALLIIKLLNINSVELSPSSETNISSESQEIPCILWNLKVHYCGHKRTLPAPVLIRIDPIKTPILFLEGAC